MIGLNCLDYIRSEQLSPIKTNFQEAAWRWAATLGGYWDHSRQSKGPGPQTGDPGSRAVRLGPWAFSVKVVHSLGDGFVGGTERCSFYTSNNFFEIVLDCSLIQLVRS